MIQKPKHFSEEYAEQFKHKAVVEAYRFRPPYSADTLCVFCHCRAQDPARSLDLAARDCSTLSHK